MAIMIGALVFIFFHLVYTDAIYLKLDEIVANIGRFANVLGRLGFAALASDAPFVGSSVVGLFLGLRR